MSKKSNTKSVVITIIITLIVLGCLTLAALQFLVPAYMNANEGQGSLKTKIYETAVKLFPLLVGIVLIVIASMIANSRNSDDEEDDEDKLPPNSYDRQLFEAPADDPTKAKPAGQPANADKESFFAMFESHEKPVQPVEQPVEQPAEQPAAEPEPVEEPVPEEEPSIEPAAPANDAPVVDAIYALIRKLDDLTDMMSVEEEDEEEDDDQDDYEYYSTQQEPEEEEVEEEEDDGSVSRIESKLDKLCEVVSNLAAVISARPAVAAPVAEAPAPKKEKPVKEVKTVEVEVPVDKKLNDIDAQDPLQRAKIEFDSAKECFYDITYAFTKAPADKVTKALPESAYVLSIKGKTVVIVPFLDKAEAQSELDKIGAKYDSVFVNADDSATFDDVIAPKL